MIRASDSDLALGPLKAAIQPRAEETVETVSEQIVELEAAVKGMNIGQHGKVKEARDLIVRLKEKKKSLAEAEKKKKKKDKAETLKRFLQEDSQERKEERREELADRKRKRGNADKHYANEIFKVSGNKKAKLTALEQMVARMRREIEEEVRLELE